VPSDLTLPAFSLDFCPTLHSPTTSRNQNNALHTREQFAPLVLQQVGVTGSDTLLDWLLATCWLLDRHHTWVPSTFTCLGHRSCVPTRLQLLPSFFCYWFGLYGLRTSTAVPRRYPIQLLPCAAHNQRT